MVNSFRIKKYVKGVIPSSLWANLRLRKLKATIRNFPVREVNHTYGGHPLTICLADPVGADWYDKNWCEPGEITLLKQHGLKPGATVFNVGAHHGILALLLSLAVGPSGRVIALEANPHNAAVALKNRDLNKMDQLTVLNVAIGAKTETISFNEGLNGNVVIGSSDWGRVDVQAYTLDDLAARYGQPDVLFIDVEGYECHVLEGAKQVLTKRPDCYVEVHLGGKIEGFGGSAESLLSFFSAEKYNRFVAPEMASSSQFRSIENVSPELLKSKFLLVAVGNQISATI